MPVLALVGPYGLVLGVAAVFTPKDFGLTEVISGVLATIRTANGLD